jgi:hypothetical protein
MSSWRDAAGKQGSSGKDPAWRLNSDSSGSSEGADRQNGPRKGRRWFKGLVSGSGAVLALFLLYVLTNFIGCERAHIYVTSAGSGAGKYSHPAFSEIVFGEEDAASLVATGTANSRLTVEQTPREIDFDSLYGSSNPSDTLIVYLCVHGGDDQDRAVFYPNSFDPDNNSRSSIRADSLWNALEKQPRRQKKLVLLDVTRSPMEERLGFFQNRFLDSLDDRVRDIPNLFVISANSAGETNWTSPQLGAEGRGGSVFAHFVAKGLRGEADTLQVDGRVSVLELFQYVHRHVNSWVRQNRHLAGQHPQLFPTLTDSASENNFRIVSVAGSSQAVAVEDSGVEEADPPSSDPPETSSASVRRDVAACWNDLNALREEPATAPYQLQPVRWRLAHVRLMEAEQWLARSRPDRATPLVVATRDDVDTMRRTGSLVNLVRKSDNQFVTRNLLEFLPASGSSTPAARDTSGGDGPVLLPAHVKTLIDTVWLSPAATSARQSVESLMRRVEESCHPAVGALPLIRKPIKRATEQRRVAFDRLMLADIAQVKIAVEQTRQACMDMDKVSAAWQSCDQTLNRAHSVLPELFRWSAARLSNSSIRTQLVDLMVDSIDGHRSLDLDVLAELAPAADVSRSNDYDGLEVELFVVSELTARLQAEMFLTTKNGSFEGTQDELRKLTADINGRLDRVRKRFNDLADNFLESQQYHVEHWQELRSLLRVPFLTAETRLRVLDQQKTAATRLFATKLDIVSEIEPAPAADNMDMIWPALCSVRCLMLGEDDPSAIADLNGAWLTVWLDTTKNSSSALPELGEDVRRAWFARRQRANARFGSQPTLHEIRRQLFRADQAARTIHPTDAMTVLAEGNSAEQLRLFYLAEQNLENSRRYAEDFWARWYSTAVADCLTSAGAMCSLIPESITATIQNRLNVLQRLAIHPRLPNGVEFGSRDIVEVKTSVSVDEGIPEGSLRLRAVVGSNGVRTIRPFDEIPSGDEAKQTIEVTFERTGYDASDCEISGELFVDFRGHRFTDPGAAFPVWPCPPKGIRFRYEPAPQSGAVLVDGVDRRPVLFILDGSGSMEQPLAGANLNRLTVAKDSLEAILKQMAKVNTSEIQKRKAAFYSFGHKAGPLAPAGNPTFPPERLQTWVGEQRPDLEVVDPALIKRLRSLLLDRSKFKPQGNTMLLEAMRDCCQSLHDLRQSGLVVAITDGADSYVEARDPQAAKLIQQISGLRTDAAAQGAEIELHLVAFDVTPGNAALLRGILKNKRDRFFNAPNAQMLAAALKSATDPRPYTVTPRSRFRGGDVRTGPLGKPIEQLNKGKYQVSFGGVPSFDVEIRGGELLKYQLGDQQLSWETLTEVPLSRETSQSGLEQLAVTRFEVNLEKSQAEFTVCLLPQDSSTLFIARPKDIQFQISAREDVSFTPRPLAWKALSGQSAPTWEVTVSDWPGRSGANVTAHWNPRWIPSPPLSLNSDEQQAVELGELQGIQRKLQITSVEFKSGVPGGMGAQFFVECTVDPPLRGPEEESVFAHLAGTKFGLLLDGDPIDSGTEREIIETDGLIRVTFTQLPIGDRTRYGLEVIPWSQRLTNATRPVRPLSIAKPEN